MPGRAAPQLARICFLGFVFLAVTTPTATGNTADRRLGEQESPQTGAAPSSPTARSLKTEPNLETSYFTEASKLVQAGTFDNLLPLYEALAHGAVQLLRAESDSTQSIEEQSVLTYLQRALTTLRVLSAAEA